mmetsp:Transcript_32041/g.36398  ORF Transcript_32041/g.36398 Transcript_32041/m.36398 type:complete len:87 (-) Transcript_32041:203-463(-)
MSGSHKVIGEYTNRIQKFPEGTTFEGMLNTYARQETRYDIEGFTFRGFEATINRVCKKQRQYELLFGLTHHIAKTAQESFDAKNAK